MKKPIVAAVAVGGLAAAWTAGWYGVRAFVVEPEADAMIERLRAGDLFLSYDRRVIAGFPLGYDISYEGVAVSDAGGLWRWTAPWMRAASAVEDAGAIVIDAAPESRIALAAAMLGGGAEDAPVDFVVAAPGMRATVGGPGENGAVRIEAPALTATQEAAGGVVSDARLGVEALAARFAADEALGMYRGALTAERAELSYTISPDAVTVSARQTTLTGLEADFDVVDLVEGDLAGFIAGGGRASARLSAARVEGREATTGGPSAPPLEVAYSGEGSLVELTVAEGRARYAGRVGPATSAFSFEGGGPVPDGDIAFAEVSLVMEMPVRMAAEPQPYDLAAKISGVEASAGIWDAFDPAGRLDRAPIEVVFDVGGDARVLTDFSGGGMGGQPIDLETLTLDDVALTALGVEARATGALEIAGEAMRSDGTVTLEVRGALGLVDRLVSAGILPPDAAAAYGALADVYARRGDGDDHLISEIVARGGRITVNGVPVSQ